MIGGQNKRLDIIHWAIFVGFAIMVTVYLVNYANDIKNQLTEITNTQTHILEILELD